MAYAQAQARATAQAHPQAPSRPAAPPTPPHGCLTLPHAASRRPLHPTASPPRSSSHSALAQAPQLCEPASAVCGIRRVVRPPTRRLLRPCASASAPAAHGAPVASDRTSPPAHRFCADTLFDQPLVLCVILLTSVLGFIFVQCAAIGVGFTVRDALDAGADGNSASSSSAGPSRAALRTPPPPRARSVCIQLEAPQRASTHARSVTVLHQRRPLHQHGYHLRLRRRGLGQQPAVGGRSGA